MNRSDQQRQLEGAEAVIEAMRELVAACHAMGIKPASLAFKTRTHANLLEEQAKTLASIGNPLAEVEVTEVQGKTLIAGLRLEVHW